MARVFISYSHKDQSLLPSLVAALRSLEHEVWWDDELRAHDKFKIEIDQRLADVEVIIALWSPNSVGSSWVLDETRVAADGEKLLNIRYQRLDESWGQLIPSYATEMHIHSLADWDEKDTKARPILELHEAIWKVKNRQFIRRAAEGLDKVLPGLGQSVTKMGLLDFAGDTPLPGGLQVGKLIGGTLFLTLVTWGMLNLAQFATDHDDSLSYQPPLRIFFGIIMIRALNQMPHMLEKSDYKAWFNNFFDEAFSVILLSSTLLGFSVAFGLKLLPNNSYSIVDVVGNGIVTTGFFMLCVTLIRLIWAILRTVLKRMA
jgi:hypothetical protein